MKKNFFDAKVLNTKFRTEDNTVYCDMTVKVNLRHYEEMFFQFNQSFIKNVIGTYLPIVCTVTNANYSMNEPVVAKYYILPGGTAKVLAFNRKYYRHVRGKDTDFLPQVGDIIPARTIIKPLGECVEYDYCETFKVTAKAACAPEDTFVQSIGEKMSLYRAELKAASTIDMLYRTVKERAKKMLDYNTILPPVLLEWQAGLGDVCSIPQPSISQPDTVA